MSAQSTYPLSPLQQGMLFHALAEPRSGVDIEQLVFTLREPVDAERLRAAWEQVMARHEILRTAFRWDGQEPMQEARADVKLDFSVEEEADERRLAAWLQEDRARGFAMDAAPLLRFRLFRLQEEEWRLVWTFHHALLDGRSFPPLIEEAFGYYDSPKTQAEAARRPYREFIEWHETQDHAQAEAFWREHLKGFHAPTPLPIDGAGKLAAEKSQGDAELALSAESTASLRAFAKESGVTLNTLVQAAWAVLLHRMSGEEDVCFGATRAGRKGTVDGAEEMIGLFINTVPVRVGIGPETPLAEVLRKLREQWVAMRPHEHAPLARVQTWSDVPGGQPLFRTLVVFENYDLASHFRARGGAWARRDLRLYEQTNFPICLAAYAGEKLRFVAEYDRSRLDDSLVRGLLGQLRTVLEAMPAGRGGKVGELPLLTPPEAAAAVAGEPQSFPATETLHARFARQAARTPDAVALVQSGARMTYAQLQARSNAVAAHLATQGVAAESIVGLCVERCPDLVVGLLGILKANAAYLPIDLAYPPERLAFMLGDAQAPVLLTQRHLAERLPPGHGAKLVFIEEIPATAEAISLSPGNVEQLCYVLYTSGSTGKPKGCCITHRNVVRLFSATDPWFHFAGSDVWTLFHSTAFDFSVWELWGALLHGGTLVVVPFDVSRSPELFHELLVREKVTVLNQTPSAFRQLIAADALSARHKELALRYVVFGGEALEMRTLQPWFERHGDEKPRLINMYGITETTVHVTYRPLRADDVTRASVIGVPIPDLQLLVLDGRLRPVPVGMAGELFVGGAGLARGYHQRPELTGTRFIPNPFVPGERLYRTGDLVRRLPDGDLEYLGRIDQQVKIRGFRIELGEIESVLLKHPRIRETVVQARDDGYGGKKLVAWMVEDPNAPEATSADLRTHLKAFVPDYMVPSAFVRLERMPLTNNGKLDARALPEPTEERTTATEFAAPTTHAELILAEIWQRILKVPRVGIHDNFFELGGDSILTILVVSQARQKGLTLTPKLLFDFPTIAELAARAQSTKASHLPDLPAEGEVPLTPIQRWFFRHDFAAPHHWNQSIAFKLTQRVSRAQLTAAIAQVVAAHPVFQLQFERTESGWRQSFASMAAGELEYPGDERFLQGSLRLSGPLLRYVHRESERTLTIAIHHLVVDGVSWRVLLEDLDAALRGVTLPPRTNGFHTWAHALASAQPGPEERAHWRAIPSPTPLPRDHEKGENLESSTRTHVLILEEAETANLRDRPVQEVLLAALAHALHAMTGRRDHVVEIEGHGREEAVLATLAGLPAVPDVSRTVGWFTTIFPIHLRAATNPAQTLAETAAHLASVPNRGIGYLLTHEEGSGAEVLFNYLGQFDQVTAGLGTLQVATLDTTHWHAPGARRTHVLEINCLVLHGRLEVRFTYSTALHRPEIIEHLATVFTSTLRTLKDATPDRSLSHLEPDHAKEVRARYPNAQDAYPLTPMQQLFLALETAKPGSGMEQWHCRLLGAVDPQKLRDAWRRLAARHPTLRTAYVTDLGEPQQVVLTEAAPEWYFADWRMLTAERRERNLRQFLAVDASKPFDVARAPLTRLALLRTDNEEHVFVWTHHHLEIDGWSWPIVFRELHALLQGDSMAPAPKYREYLDWLDGRPDDTLFWKEHLAGFRESTPLPFSVRAKAPAEEVRATLGESEQADLLVAARQHRVTVNALVQAAWACLLAHYAKREEVVFGAAFSGRPAELPGAESIVGHFVNNVPIRARVSADDSLVTIAQRLHQQLAEIAEHQHMPLPDIKACSDLPWNARLFSTLVVFQNYLGAEAQLGRARMVDLHAPVRTNYPLTLVINPGERFSMALISQTGMADATTLKILTEELVRLLGGIARAPAIRDMSGIFVRREQPVPPPESAAVTVPASVPVAIPVPESEPTPLPEASNPVPAAAAASTTDLERTIGDVWRDAFGRAVSVHENFFDLGGHSLLMLQVHTRLASSLGRNIPVVKLFQYPTIRTLAQALGDTGSGPTSEAIVAAQGRGAKARAAMARRPLNPRKK